LSSPMATPLERRRLRAAILREGNRRLLSTPPRAARLAAWLAAGAILVGLSGHVFWKSAPAPHEPSSLASRPGFEVRAVGAAQWNVDRSGSDAQVTLREGTVSIHVAKLAASQHFVL